MVVWDFWTINSSEPDPVLRLASPPKRFSLKWANHFWCMNSNICTLPRWNPGYLEAWVFNSGHVFLCMCGLFFVSDIWNRMEYICQSYGLHINIDIIIYYIWIVAFLKSSHSWIQRTDQDPLHPCGDSLVLPHQTWKFAGFSHAMFHIQVSWLWDHINFTYFYLLYLIKKNWPFKLFGFNKKTWGTSIYLWIVVRVG